MIACLDVDYRDDGTAKVACLLFEASTDNEPIESLVAEVNKVEPYVSGEFYKRELPCLLMILNDIKVDLIIIDGFVEFDNQEPALGHHLYYALESPTPVIGVAKNPHKGYENCHKVYRGDSSKPLWVTSIGFEIEEAKDFIKQMHGKFRFPTLLKLVDSVCRE